MTRPRHEADSDSARAYELAIAVRREQCIRSGQILPSPYDAREKRWAEEGPVDVSQLETVRGNG